MLTRLIILFFLAFATFILMRIILRKSKLSVKEFFRIYFVVLFGVVLIFLAVTGFFNPLFGLFAFLIPFLMRIISWVPRGFQLFSLFNKARNFRSTSSSNNRHTSEINTKYLHMILFHENGKMNGDVLEGKYINAKLNDLSLDQMLELQKECSKDPDSLSLLEAFLDREYANWRDKIESNSDTSIITSSFMNERQAEEILGLTKEATREQIIQAHRKLMQKLHPDRGGSTFLAAKVNEAKSVLLRKIIK
ncbi:MAG: hypothetical protein CMP95_07355 [Gammaproteobacteria bacterium]|nr:hypothetical protein [Gammaproteobacteria bacterium]OUV67835.1 MAG: hypothetical protein CBC93_03700 [Gammaproteobacteria bacterium TMED133]